MLDVVAAAPPEEVSCDPKEGTAPPPPLFLSPDLQRGETKIVMTGDAWGCSSGCCYSGVAKPIPRIKQGPENRLSHGSPCWEVVWLVGKMGLSDPQPLQVNFP